MEQRVELIPRWISEEEKAELIARSAGVLYIPFDEDSMATSRSRRFMLYKPVITCRDSGGTLEIIEDGVNGLVADPDADLARSSDRRSPIGPGPSGRNG